MRIKDIDFGGMSEKALWNFWKNYGRPSREQSEKLVGDRRPGFTGIAAAAGGFASNYATGKGCVRTGDKQAAEVYFNIAESIRQRMPADIRPKKPSYSTRATKK